MHDVLLGVTMYLLIALSVFFTCLRDHIENPAVYPDYTVLQVFYLSMIWPLSGFILVVMEIRYHYLRRRIARDDARAQRRHTYRLLEELRHERFGN